MNNMWFKQLSIYRLNKDNLPDLDTLNSKLQNVAFKPCIGLNRRSIGFGNPVPFRSEMVFSAENTWRITLETEEKILPASVVRFVLDSYARDVSNYDRIIIDRQYKEDLKESVNNYLLPRAFTKSGKTEAIIDIEQGLLLINQAKSKRAELLLAQLRNALGGLEATIPHTKHAPETLMAKWLKYPNATDAFKLDGYCEIKGPTPDEPVVRFYHKYLLETDVIKKVESGATITQLGLCWRNKVRFILTRDLTLKRIQFLDVVQEEVARACFEDRCYGVHGLVTTAQIFMTRILAELTSELLQY